MDIKQDQVLDKRKLPQSLIWMGCGVVMASVIGIVGMLYVRHIPTSDTDETHIPVTTDAFSPEEIMMREEMLPVSQPLATAVKIPIGDVPFVAQAPFGEWDDPIFQNGCEEASLIMVAHWILGTPLTQANAKQMIVALSRFEEKRWGHFIDTSIQDTDVLLREYFGVSSANIVLESRLADMYQVIADGKIIIVPVDGRKLRNPHFTQPGPETHMLVVVGYDAQKKEFVTNDPGTRYGKNYRYAEDVLYDAMRDYPTGRHLPIVAIRKNILVVGRE